MQRYHGGSCTSALNNIAIGGPSARDTARADSSSLPANFSINPRRPSQLSPYKLKCEKESVNSRLGPPDFHPQTPNCPEETLTREYVQSGYRETVEGLEEAREISLTQFQNFTKTVVLNCKEAIRKRLRAINESRVQKRKAGQIYGVALSGPQLSKVGVYPEQKACGEDFQKKWIEGLSQQHKRLRSLADHVPHGYRKKTLLEVLIRNNVPLLRATWFIKVTYLNQFRPGSASIASGAPDKIQLSRSDLWTKDVVDYLQCLLDDFFSKNNSRSTPHSRDHSPQLPYAGSLQHRADSVITVSDREEPSLHFKWWYIVRLLQWHHAEGLLIPSVIIDWVLNQLQEKELLEILQLLFPIIYGFLETVVLSQTYVRTLAGIALRIVRDPGPGGSDLVDNSRRAYTTSALVEMLRYLILAVPDTFVALDCFPLPPSVVSHTVNDGNFVSKASEATGKIKISSDDAACVLKSKGLDAQYETLAFDHVVSSIQKRAEELAKAASPGYAGHSVAKAAQALDKSLMLGDVRGAYKFLFEDLCDGSLSEGWVEEVSPCLRSSLKWMRAVTMSILYSVFFVCEWATCDFRDFRTAPPHDLKFTGRKDLSQVYIAIRLLKMMIKDVQLSPRCKNGSTSGVNNISKSSSQQTTRIRVANMYKLKCNSKIIDAVIGSSDIFESPGPLHDIIVCWIDQHVVHKGEGSERLHLLIVELIRAGIFYPQAYARQLIVSGIMDMHGHVVDLERRMRHYRVLKQLPGPFLHDALEEAGIAEGLQLVEVLQIYSNERRLILHGLFCSRDNNSSDANITAQKKKQNPVNGKNGASIVSLDQRKTVPRSFSKLSVKNVKRDAEIEELKSAISVLLRLPSTSSSSTGTGLDSQGSVKRPIGSLYNKVDLEEATPGCEECKRAKRLKFIEERSSYIQGQSPVPSDDEDIWWVKKGLKLSESFKVDQPLKSTKQVTKSRQKTVRKTSVNQLAAARIEGSQGASTSHVCDNKVSCPHHRSAMERDVFKSVDGIRTNQHVDVVSIGKSLKQLRCVEKRAITIWLMTNVRQLVEETEKAVGKAGQFGRPFIIPDDRSSIRWKLGEDELSAILYLMDVSNDLISAVKFILWLLPKVIGGPNSTIRSGRNTSMVSRNVESQVCEVGEAFLLSSLRRYENTLAAADLIPEALSASMDRVAAIIASNGRVQGSGVLVFACYLLKKYGKVVSVIDWEKTFKATGDKRLSSELECGRSVDGESGFPLGVPAGVEDLDDFFRQKISSGRLSRLAMGMRDIVQQNVEDFCHYLLGKERKLFATGTPKGPPIEKWDNGYQIAQQIVVGLTECIRQTGGAAQEGDPSLVSSAVSAIVGSIGPTIAKMPDFSLGNNYSNISSATGSLNFARCILRMHITCLCLLKEALGERQSRVFEIALATEASSALAGLFTPGKASRAQFQMSPEALDTNTNMTNDILNNCTKVAIGRATKSAAAISALVVGAVIHGVTSLERMVTILRLKEGLDVIQFVRSTRSSSNGNARSVGAFKVDSSLEVYVHLFRLLIGNCRTICEGLVVELLGEPYIVALSRMQRSLPLSLVFPPAYSIFAFVVWRPYIMNTNIAVREDSNQLYQSLTIAVSDAARHFPFRDVCLRDSQGLYDLMAADTSDAVFATLLDLKGSDMHLNSMAFVPLRARLFLNAIIDCRMTQSILTLDDGSRISGHGESKVQYRENLTKLQDKLVHVLDTLQPAKFHWQWIELRLLLNEQALIEKIDMHDVSLAEAIQSSSPGPEKATAASDNENNFIVIIFTRLLVRPDAAPLFSELVHLFGRSLEDSMLLQAKWFLGGHDVLFGRKTIRQRLINIAESRGLSIKTQFSEHWGWCNPCTDPVTNKVNKKKLDVTSLEEGEVVDEGLDMKRSGKGFAQMFESETFSVSQQQVTERALIELVLACIDQSSDESRNTFASDLIKQLNNIEQQITSVTRGASKPAVSSPPGIEVQTNKVSSRKSIKGGSPGLARRQTVATDSAPPSSTALRASMSLRLQLLMRFLPVLCADGEPSARNMRHTLASVILRLLGNRVVHEDVNLLPNSMHCSPLKMDEEKVTETAFADFPGDSLFERLLLVLHGLMSSCQPSWLRSKVAIKMVNESNKDFSGFDHELVENLQNDLDRMLLSDTIRRRIQTAMPVLLPSVRCSISCQPPFVPVPALVCLQPSVSVPGFNFASSNPPQRNLVPLATSAANISGKLKQQDNNMEIDPWTFLEDGAGSGPSPSTTGVIGGGDHANLRASCWLKGAVRVRRTDLTYIGAVDDDS
ncbi:Mediator of RNA polymerase II transcription subunit 12 [Quillaja saponaria]|uniref:Mediator of RNA polymerase II transcription subunit 12 n=1 Tax=Quillaja saponaria TaxID=32244 RepID=A0AAD7P9P0_QUISA|nr:Mediator of RNA polymerase II transcription subunit 12 [Quillaja saponaria]